MFYKPQLTQDEAALLDAAKLRELLDDKRKWLRDTMKYVRH